MQNDLQHIDTFGTAMRPAVVVFDVVETVFALDPLRDALELHGLRDTTCDLFFTRLLRDAFALAASGEYRPFAEVAQASLAVVAPALSPHERRDVLGAFGRLPVHPDAVEAFERLRAEQVGTVLLTNGSASTTSKLVSSNGLDHLIDDIVSVDEVRSWKPAPAPYRHVVQRLAVQPGRVALVAVHAWDVHGAKSAGLVTGWAARLERSFAPVYAEPDVTGDDLIEVIDRLLTLPG
ncbi:MAG: haloacid dehalogenase type II [Ilumatobacteraceae bacterium]